jgi:hypothetical protein
MDAKFATVGIIITELPIEAEYSYEVSIPSGDGKSPWVRRFQGLQPALAWAEKWYERTRPATPGVKVELLHQAYATSYFVRRFERGETFSEISVYQYGSRAGERDGWEVIGNELIAYLPGGHADNGHPYGTRAEVVARRTIEEVVA